MVRQFENQVALVTGGSNGIGRATAIAFAREGAKVIVSDMADAAGEETVAAIRAAGGDARYARCDVRDGAQIASQPHGRVLVHEVPERADAQAGVGGDRQQRLHPRPGRLRECFRVRGRQAWFARPHPLRGARVFSARHPGERGVPGVHRHADAGARRSAERSGHPRHDRRAARAEAHGAAGGGRRGRPLPRVGQRLFIGSGAAEPVGLVEALVAHGGHLADNDVVHLLTLGCAPYVRPELAGRFRHSAFFIGPNVREAADLVLAEVNPLMPRTLGDAFVHVDDIDGLVPVERPVLELHPEAPDDVSMAIGRHVASLIPEGATLQTGIGKIPHAVLRALSGHRDLGIHTEMLSDTVIDLVEAGVINGRKKTLLPGKIVTSFVMGTQRLYDWVHDNPIVQLMPSDFTNDPFVIARNDAMVAINSALAVDLTGQVAADTVDGRFFSGIGGQVDFIRGAARSKDGKPIIALPSTARGGTVSRIQAVLEAGAGVVTSRGDVHFVVTEFGVADLWGKTVRERAESLIEVAHPDFRSELVATAKARKYVLPGQRVPRAPLAGQESRSVRLESGADLTIRLVRMSDEEALQDLFYRVSEHASYERFLGHVSKPSHEELLRWADVDYDISVALVATVPTSAGDEFVALGRYDIAPATRFADVSLLVVDAWQSRGVGTAVFRRLAEIARARGAAGFRGDVLVHNARMLAIFNETGNPVESTLSAGVYHVRMAFS